MKARAKLKTKDLSSVPTKPLTSTICLIYPTFQIKSKILSLKTAD